MFQRIDIIGFIVIFIVFIYIIKAPGFFSKKNYNSRIEPAIKDIDNSKIFIKEDIGNLKNNNYKQTFFRKTVGFSILFYGIYLATLTGSTLSVIIPGIGAIGSGAAAGAGIGFITNLFVGTVGVATGGLGIAIGLPAMMLAGTIVGAAGASFSNFSVRMISYPLVSPFFWIPLIIIGIFLLSSRKMNNKK